MFYAYSHKDESLRDKLATHLSILQRNGIISGWHDREIPAGTEWTDRIDDNLNAADIILLLVSPEFLASTYCYDKEMMRAMQRHEAGEARVIPIAIKPCLWEVAPFSKLQGLPKDMKAVTTWANRDEAFREIAVGIQKAAGELRQRPPKPSTSDSTLRRPESEDPPARRNVDASSVRERGRAHLAKWRPDSTTLLFQGPHIKILIGRTEPDLGGHVPEPESRWLPVRALIDTGASLTVINPEIAATCKLKQTGHQMINAVGGQAGEFPAYAAAISFPGTELPGLDATRVVACPIIRQPFFSCLIGRDIMRKWLLTYDGRTGGIEITA